MDDQTYEMRGNLRLRTWIIYNELHRDWLVWAAIDPEDQAIVTDLMTQLAAFHQKQVDACRPHENSRWKERGAYESHHVTE